MHNVGNGSNTNRSIVYDGKIAGLYDLEETLGSGHFAVVKLARHVFTGEKVAVKVIDKTKLDEVSRAHLFQEVRCMKLVQHPNVVRLYEVIDTQTKLYLILELGDGGDLYDYIMKHEGGLSENLAREYFRQIVRAISYCHKLHVVHRDLKPENVVFFEKLGVVKLTDFGFSNKFCPGQKLETSCGSLAYSAPEILLGDSYDAPAVDIWSLGVILYMLVCGQPPFEKANDSETLTMIMDCKYTMPPHVSQGCRKLIGSMLVRAPEKRATLEQIAKDSWLMDGVLTQEQQNKQQPQGGVSTQQQQQHQQQQQQQQQQEYLPLVSRQQVSEEDHTLIIQKMVNGNIATKEEILDALDRNEYNHITATYFLLAERKLRQQRQEQMQKRRPDLSLPVSSQTRLSPRSRIQGIKDKQAIIDANNQLLVPTSSQISAPRTPGAETSSGGRTRKCSIVQEEEDDEDEIPNCSKRDDLLSAPLNRRGSRSEGRINLAVQDKVTTVTATQNAVTPTRKDLKTTNNQQTRIGPTTSRGIENISGVKYIKRTNDNVRMRLGMPRIPAVQVPQIIKTDITIESDNLKQQQQQQRSNSLDQHINLPIQECGTTILVDSSTITIPITSSTQSNALINAIPKYKTMPSPTRPCVIMSGPRPLNEIFEEGTDIGSSDSATTTPRPIIRAHFTGTNRGGAGSSTNAHQHHHHHRRTKFHKTRTPSCSSSDASDDDSESRKKRAHKMAADISKPFQSQRRDSHDDSSDSQDPGTTASGGNTITTAALIYSTSNNDGNNTGGTDHNNSHHQNNKTNTNGKTSTKDTTCQRDESEISEDINQQKTDQPISYRRHRNGRRRASETRLRESQSLNRITEVQESELPPASSLLQNTSSNNHQNNQQNLDNNSTDNRRSLIEESTIEQKPVKCKKNITTGADTAKPKGFSARLFHGFIRNKNSNTISNNNDQQHIDSNTKNNGITTQQAITPDPNSADDVDVVLGVIRDSTNPKSSSTTKKLKMLGKYFQVHKKICIPSIFHRATGGGGNNGGTNHNSSNGRLYKAQSCGSIERNRVNQNPNNLNAITPSNGSSGLPTNRHSSVLFTEKSNKILKNCLGARFLNSSDSDINQNTDNKINNYNNSDILTTKSFLLTMSPHLSVLQQNQKQQQQQENSQKNLLLKKQHFDINDSPEEPPPPNLDNNSLLDTNSTLNLAQNNCSNSNSCNNLSSNSKISLSSSSPHQINDVPLCSSKC